MKKLMLLAVVLIFSMALLSAQTIAEYTFSTTTDGTLEDMTGSTALLSAAYHDDDASPVTNIGFTFGFGLGAYTQFSANSNGQMQLGPTAIAGGNSGPSANLPRLAPLYGDNSIQTTGALHYKVVGSEPNRKLVVEWFNLRVNYANDTTGTYCTMQAWLYEGTNNIKFVYGTMWNMSTSAQSRGVYVSTSNVAGSVGNVTDIINTMTWTNTGTSVVTTSFPASSAMANLNSPNVGERRVFHINYPVYTTPPNPAVLVSPANNAWVFTDATLNWTSGGGGATSYDVYFGTSATPPFVVNQGATSYTPALAPGNTYYWNIVAKNEHGDAAATDTWSFKTPTATQLAESFEVAVPPAGWANPGSWSRSTSYPKHGVATAYKYGSTSTQYVLSTPMVTLTGTSSLNLWSASGSTTGILQVVYSPDRFTWTQVGANIHHAATNTMYNSVIDLSSLAGNNYYLGVRTGLQSASFYIDYVFGPEITPEAPGPVTLAAPADLAVDLNPYVTFSWTAPTTGGVPTGYRVLCDTNPTPTTVLGTVTGLTYTPTTPLAYGTPYYWTVEAYNGTGSATTPTPRMFTTWADPTVTGFPWTESFDGTTFAPLGWGNIKTAGTGTPGIWDRQTAGTYPTCAPYSGAAMARYNAYNLSGGTKGELTTPPLAVPNGEAYRVNFWMYRDSGYETYNNEVVNVYVNTSPTSTGATLLGTISRYYNFAPAVPAANAWYQYTMPFTGSVADKYVIFEAVSQFGNNMFIDHVTIEEVPADPIFVLSPNVTEWDFGANVINTTATKQFTITNNGGGTLTLNSVTASGDYYSISVAPTDTELTAGESTSFTVQYAPTVEGTHTGLVTITDGRLETTIDLTGSCFDPTIVDADLPYTENFDGTWAGTPAAPAGWTVINADSDSYLWSQGNIYITPTHSEPYAAHGMGNLNDYLITPQISLTVNGRIKWWDKVESASYVNSYKVLVSTTDTDTTSFTDDLGTFNCANTAWMEHTLNLDAYANQTIYVAFYQFASAATNWGFGIDDVLIDQIPSGPPLVVTLDTPADGTIDMPATGFNLAWTPAATGGIPTYYGVYLSQDTETIYSDVYFETTGTTLNPATYADGPSDPVVFGYDERWYWTVEAFNGDGSAVVDPPQWFEIEPDPTVPLPFSQDFEGATSLASINWSGNMYVNTPHGVNAGKGAYFNLYDYEENWTCNAITPPVGPMPANPTPSQMLFDYRIVNWDGYPATATALGTLDNVQIQISTDGGANYTTIHTINQANHVTSNLFAPVTIDLSAYASQIIMIQFLGTWGAGDYFLDIDNVIVRETPTEPIFNVSPTVGAYGEVELNVASPITFVVSNIGVGSLDINSIGISGTDQASFVLLNPPTYPVQITDTPASFVVQFTPTTLGEKTALLTITDALTRTTHDIPLSGTGIPEAMMTGLTLSGSVISNVNVQLNWVPVATDGFGTWVHYDDGVNATGVGYNGPATFAVAIKYSTATLTPYIGQNLTSIKFIPYVADALYTVKIWKGTDGVMAPSTLLYSSPVPYFTSGTWNEHPINPIAINGTDAIYIGYEVTTTWGYPAGADAGPALVGYGDLLYTTTGEWVSMMTGYAINRNWNLQGYFTPGPPVMSGNLLNIPVVNNTKSSSMRNAQIPSVDPRFSSTSSDRFVTGYNVYRNTVLITPTPVQGLAYLDSDLTDGNYDYYVVAQYANGTVTSNTYSTPITGLPPIDLPFLEDWSSSSLDTNSWIAGSTNWFIETTEGNATPSVKFSWTPQVLDYDIALTSFRFDGTDFANIKLKFDIALDNYSTDAENLISWDVFDGTTWHTMGTISSLIDDFGWTTYASDITAFAAGHNFKIRFRAHGEDSFEINFWYIDNIRLELMPTTLSVPANVELSVSGTDLTLGWDAVAGADWYAIYVSDDPYADPYTYAGWLNANGITLPAATFGNPGFLKITAGAGAEPGRGTRLDTPEPPNFPPIRK